MIITKTMLFCRRTSLKPRGKQRAAPKPSSYVDCNMVMPPSVFTPQCKPTSWPQNNHSRYSKVCLRLPIRTTSLPDPVSGHPKFPAVSSKISHRPVPKKKTTRRLKHSISNNNAVITPEISAMGTREVVISPQKRHADTINILTNSERVSTDVPRYTVNQSEACPYSDETTVNIPVSMPAHTHASSGALKNSQGALNTYAITLKVPIAALNVNTSTSNMSTKVCTDAAQNPDRCSSEISKKEGFFSSLFTGMNAAAMAEDNKESNRTG